MANILAQVTFERASGLPEDRVVNNWHFSTPTPHLANSNTAIQADLLQFYTASVTGTGFSVASFLSSFLNGLATTRLYNLDEPKPRIPIAEFAWSFTPTVGGVQLPAEVSVVLSYSGTPTSGVALRSNRGRIYLGPWRAAAGVDSVSDFRPTVTLRQTIAEAAGRLIAASSDGLSAWIVYSGTRRARGQTPFTTPVDFGFVDDAFDTQRRRGRDATTRSTFT